MVCNSNYHDSQNQVSLCKRGWAQCLVNLGRRLDNIQSGSFWEKTFESGAFYDSFRFYWCHSCYAQARLPCNVITCSVAVSFEQVSTCEELISDPLMGDC